MLRAALTSGNAVHVVLVGWITTQSAFENQSATVPEGHRSLLTWGFVNAG